MKDSFAVVGQHVADQQQDLMAWRNRYVLAQVEEDGLKLLTPAMKLKHLRGLGFECSLRWACVVNDCGYFVNVWEAELLRFDLCNPDIEPVIRKLPVRRGPMSCGDCQLLSCGEVVFIISEQAFFSYNTVTDIITTCTNTFFPSHSAAAVYRDRLFVIVGRAVRSYDVASDSWRTEAPAPKARRLHSAVVW